MAPHSSTLDWKIPWMEEPGRLRSMGQLRVGHDWATSLSLFTFTHWRRKWQPTPAFLPGKSQGQGSLVGCPLWDHTELDTTEMTWQQQQLGSKQQRLSLTSFTTEHKNIALQVLQLPDQLQHCLRSIFMFKISKCVLSCSSPVQLCKSMDCSLPGSSVHRILQARILEQVTTLFSRGSS